MKVKAQKYPTIASLVGAAGSLPKPLSWKEMRQIAREDQLRNKMRNEEILSSTRSTTLDDTFASVKPIQRPEDFKRLGEIAMDEKVEREVQKTNKEA